MNNYSIRSGDRVYNRITKAQAQKLWGKRVIALCPCGLRPGAPWHPDCLVIPSDAQDPEREFDSYVCNFEWYNCSNNETGKYTAFYTVDNDDKGNNLNIYA